jgi:hypothetical protein
VNTEPNPSAGRGTTAVEPLRAWADVPGIRPGDTVVTAAVHRPGGAVECAARPGVRHAAPRGAPGVRPEVRQAFVRDAVGKSVPEHAIVETLIEEAVRMAGESASEPPFEEEPEK